ncbi:Holliday junction branch migration protein RuvA [Patescibacteria group bacterium]|nr:Holliday junction branch migration protein RuvA [Patescibacteria group bacterium]MBU1721319.1 Holliday junction branch migration protein RuvA [Patescibacteria group bacterium]MBU1900959.1 Holliday junction branch migration protein RuvA [Patescibacteria group bacterium]
MISYIAGTIKQISQKHIVVLTNAGLGYEVFVTTGHASELRIGQVIELPTYLKVAETALELFGFRSEKEKYFFQLLLSVKGIGPKGALNILALGSIVDVQSAIGRGDIKYLTAVQGMGKKTAERLVVELKSKVDAVDQTSIASEVGSLGEVVEALVIMGYSKEDARDAIDGLSGDEPVEVLLRSALKHLG